MTTLTAASILKIAPDEASTLFAGNEAQITSAFHALAKQWHPDLCRDARAGDVMRHLTLLRERALGASTATAAKTAIERTFHTRSGGTWRLRYLRTRPIEAGEIFIGRHIVAYLIEPGLADLAAIAATRTFRFADARMEAEMGRFLPAVEKVVETTEGTILVYKRTGDQVLLGDLIAHQGGQVEPVHVAWMLSALENITCYLCWAKLTHGAISVDNLLVSPKSHSLALTGPFLYATEYGKRPQALPGRTLHLLPRLAIAGVPVDPKVDLELVRLVGREVLGDPVGATLLHRADLPSTVALWLMTPPAGDGLADYDAWERARDAGFGPRKFRELTVSPEAVYAAT